MSEMTERERAVFSSRRNVFDGGRHHRDETKEALYFIAMHDALTAYDAAQKAADPSAPALARKMAEDRLGLLRAVTQKPAKPASPSDPVAVVRDAMGRLDKSGWSNAMPAVVWHVDRWRQPEGRSAHCDTSDGALATILNTLPALLERAERNGAQRDGGK